MDLYSIQQLACVAGVRRGGKGERRTREAREDRTQEDCGKGRLQRRNCFLHSTHWTVECLAVKIIQSESRHFFRDKICGRQLACVASVSVEQKAKNGVFGVLLLLSPCNSFSLTAQKRFLRRLSANGFSYFLFLLFCARKYILKFEDLRTLGKARRGRPKKKAIVTMFVEFA